MSRIQITLSTVLSVLLVASALRATQESPIISYRDGRLIYYPDDCGNSTELDLSDESGTFLVNTVNTLTGSVTAGEIISVGTDVTLPPSTVVWLTKE